MNYYAHNHYSSISSQLAENYLVLFYHYIAERSASKGKALNVSGLHYSYSASNNNNASRQLCLLSDLIKADLSVLYFHLHFLLTL